MISTEPTYTPLPGERVGGGEGGLHGTSKYDATRVVKIDRLLIFLSSASSTLLSSSLLKLATWKKS